MDDPREASARIFGPPFFHQDASGLLQHLRAVDRSSEHIVGVVFEERQTLNALAQLRSNKVDDPMAIDPSIAAITKSGISDPSQAAAAASASAKPRPKKK